MNVHYEPAARAEVIEAARWYLDVAGPSVADAFERELHTAIRLIVRFPQLGTPGKRGTRKLRLNGFPYTLHYRSDAETIRIMALANQKRRPGYWVRRS